MIKTAIIGLQFGDEGKGRVSAEYGKHANWFVRFNGGPNAGHTVYNDGVKHKLHHLPAGAVFGKKVALDTGMVINWRKFLKEVENLGTEFQLYISKNVHMIFDCHEVADSKGSGIGTTKSGIGPVYADRALRVGRRVGDFADSLELQTLNFYDGLPPFKEGDEIIYEGAQGIMLDIDYGCYPYVTSSSIMPSSVHKIDKVVGVMKAYTSRVGDGSPNHSIVPRLGKRGNEVGTTTGRLRRCTWNDMDQLVYAMKIVQPDEIVVTKLDILGKEKEIKVWKNNKLKTIGNLDSYCDFLVACFPKIKYFSFSPHGEMEAV